MAIILIQLTTFSRIPKFDCPLTSPNSYLRALLVPMNARDGIRVQITEFDHPIVIGIPEVQATIKSDREDVL